MMIYMNLMRQMKYPSVIGYVWYVNENRMECI